MLEVIETSRHVCNDVLRRQCVKIVLELMPIHFTMSAGAVRYLYHDPSSPND